MRHSSFLLRSCRRAGSTLIMVLFTIVILAVFIGLALDYTGSTALFSRRGQDYTAAQALANGALEVTFKRWQEFMLSNQAISANNGFGTPAQFLGFTTSLRTTINAAALSSGYQLSSLTITLVDRKDAPQSQGITYDTPSIGPLPNVPGWIAKNYSYQATAVAYKVNDLSLNASISRYFQEGDASPFQAMLFFQDDLELNVGPNMTITGPVHTNKNLYACSRANLTFNSQVSYTGDDPSKPATLNPASNYGRQYSNLYGPGYIEGVTQTLYNIENWTNFNTPTYADSITNQLSQVKSLDPLGTDVAAAVLANPNNPNASGTHEIIERPVPISATDPSANPAFADPDAFKAHRIWNSAGVRILIDRNSPTKVRVYVPNSPDGAASIPMKPGAVTNQILNAITPDTTAGSIYDMREGRNIHVDTVDMSLLTPALNGYAAYNGVVYITDITGGTGDTNDSSAIRLKKGGVLPDGDTNASGVDGLTVASDGAVYVQGDYNTGTTYGADVAGVPTLLKQPPTNGASPTNADFTSGFTVPGYTQKPASVMGDAVMALSNSWKDVNAPVTAASSSTASATTFNAAIVSGEVLTTSTTASGGAHNFPRFLENWTGKNFTYHGSMVELYASKYFDAPWSVSTKVYSAPQRPWYFDTSYLVNYPPGNLRTTTYSRGRWVQNLKS